MSPATKSWMMIRRQTPAPISLGCPYIPVSTYTMAWKENKVAKENHEYKNLYLSHSDHHAKELLSSIDESSVLGGVSNLYELGTGQQLPDQTRGDDGGDTPLHEGSYVGGKDDTDPVERNLLSLRI
jgi:hypothetical protein